MVAAILTGPEIKGAHRWIDIGPINLQPSEIVKPAFVVMVAWFLAEAARRPDTPGLAVAWGFYLLFAGLLVKQPDFGQTALVSAVFVAMLLLDVLWIPGERALGAAWASTVAYLAGTVFTVAAYSRQTGTAMWRCLVVHPADFRYIGAIFGAVLGKLRRRSA